MIEIRSVSKWYGDYRVLNECSATVAKGSVAVLCGPSGSGKSTLIRCINRLESINGGDITVDGLSVSAAATDLSALRSRVGMVFQSFELFPHRTALENINLAQMAVLRRSRGAAIERSMALLERVGLADHAHKYPSALSGGQQQRIAIARALAMDPVALLFDEPTSALDPGDDQRGARRHRRTGRAGNDDDGGDARDGLCSAGGQSSAVHGSGSDHRRSRLAFVLRRAAQLKSARISLEDSASRFRAGVIPWPYRCLEPLAAVDGSL